MADTAAYQCPLCQRQPYPNYWDMLGCAGRDLATTENPDSPVGQLLAARPVPRDDTTPVRRPTVADLTVYAIAALLKVRDTLTGLAEIADQAQTATADSQQDRDDIRARLDQAETDLAAMTARVGALETSNSDTSPPDGGTGG